MHAFKMDLSTESAGYHGTCGQLTEGIDCAVNAYHDININHNKGTHTPYKQSIT